MTLAILPIQPAHIEGYRACLDAVAHEHAHLAMAAAPPLERLRAVVLDAIANGHPHLVALDDGRVVGWCDVTPRERRTPRDCGILGMGVLAPWRGKGHGWRMIRATIDGARAAGFRRVELTVHTSNVAAIGLYAKVGFTDTMSGRGDCPNPADAFRILAMSLDPAP